MILMLLFNASSRFFSGWLNSVVQYPCCKCWSMPSSPSISPSPTGVREPRDDDEQRQRRLVGARAFRADCLTECSCSVSSRRWRVDLSGIHVGLTVAVLARNLAAPGTARLRTPNSFRRMARLNRSIAIVRRRRVKRIYATRRKSAARPADETIDARPVLFPRG